MGMRTWAKTVLVPSEHLLANFGSGARCGSWGAGSRSSRKGQAGPVREDL